MIQVPMIRKTALTGRWVCITKYKVMGCGNFQAKQQFDINQQMQEIIKSEIRASRKRKTKVK